MKVIDLLNKIANGEEVPEYITYFDRNKNGLETMMVCKANIIYQLDQISIDFNDEVEILEEDKKIEKIRHDACWIYDDETEQLEKITLKDDLILNKLDELIDEVNKLKENK